jgi:hypothetical protein
MRSSFCVEMSASILNRRDIRHPPDAFDAGKAGGGLPVPTAPLLRSLAYRKESGLSPAPWQAIEDTPRDWRPRCFPNGRYFCGNEKKGKRRQGEPERKKPLTDKIDIRYIVYRMPSSLLKLKSFAKPILRDEVYLSIKEAILTGEFLREDFHRASLQEIGFSLSIRERAPKTSDRKALSAACRGASSSVVTKGY